MREKVERWPAGPNLPIDQFSELKVNTTRPLDHLRRLPTAPTDL
jgi:sensor domain CHASE-containing protein